MDLSQRKPTVLILGGTTEGRELLAALAKGADTQPKFKQGCENADIAPEGNGRHLARLDLIYSQAGLTDWTPVEAAHPYRNNRGGFGGVDGLTQYLVDQRVQCVIDATHPFAVQMTEHAVEAARKVGCHYVQLRRRPWAATPADDWISVRSGDEALNVLASLHVRRTFLACGLRALGAFADRPFQWYWVRLATPPSQTIRLSRYGLIIDRGPFVLDAERRFMNLIGVDSIVCKNSGGHGAFAKLVVARELGLPVVMIERPLPRYLPTAEASIGEGSSPLVVSTVGEAVNELGRLLF